MTDDAAPVIETERLVLSGPRLSDFDDSAAMWRTPEVVRYIGGTPLGHEDVWNRLLRYIGHWKALGYGFWVARQKSDGRFVGELGFGDFHREVHPAFDRASEIGWGLALWAHGQGFATEAVGAAVSWGDENLNANRTVCLINPENTASVRVAEKLGYASYARTIYKDKPVVLFERQALRRAKAASAE
jgi:RimJ/RimL family protein N-acetyltransferase